MMPSFNQDKGFSLVELLLVLVIITVIVSITAPVMYKMYDKSLFILTRNSAFQAVRLTAYEAFIREEECQISFEKTKKQYISVCKGESIIQLESDKAVLPVNQVYFNTKGFAVTIGSRQ